MATNTTKTAAKPKAADKPKAAAGKQDETQNTSAPATPETSVEVSATVTPQGATQASTEAKAGDNSEGEGTNASPEGGKGDDDLVAHAVMVVSQIDGFRRAGRAWSKAPTTVPIDELTEEQLETLHREPKLTVAYLCDSVEATGSAS